MLHLQLLPSARLLGPEPAIAGRPRLSSMDLLRDSRPLIRSLLHCPVFLRMSKSTAHPELCPPSLPGCLLSCGHPIIAGVAFQKGRSKGVVHGSSAMVCMDAGSLLASGREAGPVCNVGTNFMSKKSNPELFPYHISLYDLWDKTNPWPTHQQLTPHPATAKKEATLSRCHASPLMRADGASLAHLRAQQPGRFFSLPEISIQYIMHLGLPSGEISESDLRRFTPPRSNASSLPPLHHRHHHALAIALFALVAFLPLGPDFFRCPATSPPRQDRLGQTYLAAVISRKPLLFASIGNACGCGYTGWGIR